MMSMMRPVYQALAQRQGKPAVSGPMRLACNARVP
jgi:hypothetical protein